MAEHTPATLMKRAIREARKSSAEDSRDHPLVGAVAVTVKGKIAAGHRGEVEPGEHAEFTVLEKKLRDEVLAGATVYTTLEPCTVRNPPKVSCSDRLIERRVKRVYVGMLDPDSRICGRGVRRLRDAGIEVQFFPKKLMAELEELNRNFIRSKVSQHKKAVTAPADQLDLLDPNDCEKLANTYAARGESEKAIEWGLRTLEGRPGRSSEGKERALLFLARQYRHQGLLNEALRYYASAEEHMRRIGVNSPGERLSLLRIRAGRTMIEKFFLQGDCRSALSDYETIGKEIKLLLSEDDPQLSKKILLTFLAHWKRQAAEMYRQLGRYEHARDSFRQAFEDLEYVEVAAKAWCLLGEAESSRMMGEFSQSLSGYDGAELFARNLMDFRLLARILRNRAEWARAQGFDEEIYLQELEKLSRKSTYLYGRIYRLLIEGGSFLARAEPVLARSSFLEAESLCRSDGVPLGVEAIHSTLGLGESYRLAGDKKEAAILLRAARKGYRERGVAWGYLRSSLALSDCSGNTVKIANSWKKLADWSFNRVLQIRDQTGSLPSTFENVL